MPTYLDHSATTPMHPEALEMLREVAEAHPGNPSGSHAVARDARRVIDEAREVVAALLGGRPSEVVFTGGGTEADNMAVFGVHRRRGGTVVCSAVEHHAVLEPVVATGGRTVGVDARGVIDLDALAALLDPSVTLVSVMLVNNEVGTIQPLAEVAEVVRDRAPDALLHTDAVQAFSWLPLAEVAGPADLVSVSAHKFGGPKGVGALLVRESVELAPLLLGGGQEHERRSGTQNVAGIASMATAATLTDERRKQEVDRLVLLRDRLLDGLIAHVEGVYETGTAGASQHGDRGHRVAGIAHVCFEGVEAESLLFLLDREGVCASAASSCASGAAEPSHVLAAMGVPSALAGGSLRLSLGWSTTPTDIDRALEVVPAAVERLRTFS